ncbi:hypothetical protein CCMA1212_008239 [Trichoderma ghanense]|uniref:Uncharacterized protein n=1 Tax=Trichoderma ghanense TaxID=65468 RepID=A0ABY2GWI1_9HYPO
MTGDGCGHRRTSPSSRRPRSQQNLDAIIVAPRRLRKTLSTAQPQPTCKVTWASATKPSPSPTHTHTGSPMKRRQMTAAADGTVAAGQPANHARTLGTPDLRMQKSNGREQQPSPMARLTEGLGQWRPCAGSRGQQLDCVDSLVISGTSPMGSGAAAAACAGWLVGSSCGISVLVALES